jgi:hypothetical protein
MVRKLSVTGGVLALVAALAIPAADARAPVTVSAQLKGNNEVPGPGDPNGKGEIFVTLKKAQRKVCFALSWKKIEGPQAGHIHRGGPNVAGPIKVKLFEQPGPLPVPGAVDGCITKKRKLVRRIARHPERFYVNLHNEEYPDGAIRGQLGLVL